MNSMSAPPAPATLIELRALLQAQFPQAHAQATRITTARASTGITCLDQLSITGRGFTEVVGSGPTPGTSVLLAGVMQQALHDHRHLALVDAMNAFDASTIKGQTLHRLLWVRCTNLDHSLRAADLLLRDGNVPLVVLDLALAAPRDLQRVPGSVWFRLRALCEQSGADCLALTPCSAIPSAQRRLELAPRFTVDAVDQPLSSLLLRLHLQTLRERARHALSTATRAAA
jgi:hypothetical protein